EDLDLVESWNRDDARPRAGVNENLLALEPLAVDLDLVWANEAAVGTIERKVRAAVDLVLLAAPERFYDLILAGHDRCHVHFDLARMDAELRRDSRVVCDPCTGDHRLGRRAAIVDA